MSDQTSIQAAQPPGVSSQDDSINASKQLYYQELQRTLARKDAELMAKQRPPDSRQEKFEAIPRREQLRHVDKSPPFTLEPDPSTHKESSPINSRLEVEPMAVPIELPLPVRAIQPSPRASNLPSKLSLHEENSNFPESIALNPTNLGEMEFIVPLSMSARVRDQYISTINYYQHAIQRLMQVETVHQDLITEIQDMLLRVNRITTHVDLESEGTSSQEQSQEQEAPEDEAIWAENCSSKFQFLRHLFDALRDHDFHVAVVARPGRVLNILETFLKGTHSKYSRPDMVTRSDPNSAKGRLDVTLIASGAEGASSTPRPANLVIAFDGTFNAEDVQVKLLRGHLLNVGQFSPVIHLLVYGSAEHIDRCIPTSIDSIVRIKKIVSSLIQTRNEVGRLSTEELNADALAEEVAVFLEQGGREKDWMLLSIRSVEVDAVDWEEADSQDQYEEKQQLARIGVAKKPTISKRALVSGPISLYRMVLG